MSNEEYIPILAVDPSYVDSITTELTLQGFNPIILGIVIEQPMIIWHGRKVRRYSWSHSRKRIVEL